jgi:type 1 fimbria pilin
MKKIFTLLAGAVMAMSASAATLSVTTDGTLLSNGDVLFDQPNQSWLDVFGEISIIGGIDVVSDETVNATLTVKMTQGDGSYGFCVSSSCHDINTDKGYTEDVTLSSTATHFSVEPIGTWASSIVKTFVMEVTLTKDSEVLKQFNVIVTNGEWASVKSVSSDDKAFTVSGRYIYWNMPSAPGVMSIYSLDGKVVDQKNLSAASGSTVLNLPEGIYVWTAAGHSGKICIRK